MTELLLENRKSKAPINTTVMRNRIKQILTILLIQALFIMCEQQGNELTEKFPEIIINQELLRQKLNEHKPFWKTERVTLSSISNFSLNNEPFNLASLGLSESNLNYLLSNPTSNEVISIVSFSKGEQILGYGTYFINNDNMFLEVDLKKTNRLYEVNRILLDDIMYLQEENCLGCDIYIMNAKYNDETNLKASKKNANNDLALDKFRDRFFDKSADGKYQISSTYSKLYKANGAISARTSSICGSSHTCSRGGGDTCDAWKALCTEMPEPDCGFQQIRIYTENNSLSYPGELEKKISSLSLYEVKNNLNKTLSGNVYVEGYYLLSDQFINSVDIAIAAEFLTITDDLNDLINRYLSGSAQTLISDQDFNKIVNLANQIKLNSGSDSYRETVDILISELARYKELSVNEVKQQLEQPF